MAKKSNKKAKRRKQRELAENKFAVQLAQNRVDSVQAERHLLINRENRKNYYEQLHDAVENRESYTRYGWGNANVCSAAYSLANQIETKKLGHLNRKALKRLIEVARRTKILDPDDVSHGYLTGLLNIAEYSWLWVRDPDKWKPTTKNRNKQFSSLLRCLFAKYDVPAFMDDAWMPEHDGTETQNYREWFINIGAGENIRKQKGLPISMTKKMAHHFMRAPSHLTVNEAIRWGQILALGGDVRVARGVMGSPLGQSFANDDFWVTVIRFFIDHPFLDTNQYHPIYH